MHGSRGIIILINIYHAGCDSTVQVYSFSDAGESETGRGKKGAAGLLSRVYISCKFHN